MATEYYAHSPRTKPKPRPPDGWQPLKEHLLRVAQLCEQYAREASPILSDDPEAVRGEKESFHRSAVWLGLNHDLGKYRPEFQEYLNDRRPKSEKTRHKQAGAAVAANHQRNDLALAIAGHHGGLPDFSELKGLVYGPGGRDVAEAIWSKAVADCPELEQAPPAWQGGNDCLRFDLLVRLVFSCLVDADWKDTDDFERRSLGLRAEADPPTLDAAVQLDRVLEYIQGRAHKCRDPRIATIRREVLEASLRAADQLVGLFTMTVPTGGGKTLSGLAFALAHARRHGLRRVIYVAPYLSIIEQNAREIRRALGEPEQSAVVFEHHSMSEPPGNPEGDEAESDAAARRAENWDSPVIVTTNVQFFESLFSNRPGQCRKLHNIAHSVVILDECQTLPPNLIAPTLSMLGGLAEVAKCSIVLCTATQPAWNQRPELPEGLTGVREVVPDDLHLFERLRRVRLLWPARDQSHMEWSEVAAHMTARPAALCIVNTKAAARNLFDQLHQAGCGDAFHLSTAMCPAHRLEVLDEVRRRLLAGEPCRLVSTQLIEAGVDVDFPLVLREMAPLEAIIQAAGRCNREGLLNAPDGTPGGQVIVFRSPEGILPHDRWYEAGRGKVEQALALGKEPDIGNPDDMQEYYYRLYQSGKLDARNIQCLRNGQSFKTVWNGHPEKPGQGRYRIIDEVTIPVVVATWEPRRKHVERLLTRLRSRPSKRVFRRLGVFQVNLRQYELAQAAGQVVPDPCGIQVWWGPYDPNFGISGGGGVVLPAI